MLLVSLRPLSLAGAMQEYPKVGPWHSAQRVPWHGSGHQAGCLQAWGPGGAVEGTCSAGSSSPQLSHGLCGSAVPRAEVQKPGAFPEIPFPCIPWLSQPALYRCHKQEGCSETLPFPSSWLLPITPCAPWVEENRWVNDGVAVSPLPSNMHKTFLMKLNTTFHDHHLAEPCYISPACTPGIFAHLLTIFYASNGRELTAAEPQASCTLQQCKYP